MHSGDQPCRLAPSERGVPIDPAPLTLSRRQRLRHGADAGTFRTKTRHRLVRASPDEAKKILRGASHAAKCPLKRLNKLAMLERRPIGETYQVDD